MNNLLVNRKYDIEGHWYMPERKLQSFKSVIKAELWDTTSSSGDWSGYFIQKIKNIFYLIPFYQNNNWPKSGFTLYTDKVIATWDNKMLDEDTINHIMEDYCYS